MLPEMYVKKHYVKEKLPPPNPFAIQMLNFQKKPVVHQSRTNNSSNPISVV